MHRVGECTRINMELATKVDVLEQENRTLVAQLAQLREMVAKAAQPVVGTGRRGISAGMCLMMVALSFSLFFNPNSSVVAGGNGTSPAFPASAANPAAASAYLSQMLHSGASAASDAGSRSFYSRTLKSIADTNDDADGSEIAAAILPLGFAATHDASSNDSVNNMPANEDTGLSSLYRRRSLVVA